MHNVDDITELFEKANSKLLLKDKSLFSSNVNERTICGALAAHLYDLIKNNKSYHNYYADVEYNRNDGKIKAIIDENLKIIPINCDLIVHSRGENPEQDNLLAIEMKKSNRPEREKLKDKNRLIALTRKPYEGVWVYDGSVFPEYVCDYVLGVYYEINIRANFIMIEYYHQGKMIFQYTKYLSSNYERSL